MDCPRGLTLVGNLQKSAKKAAEWLVNKRPIKTIRDWGISFSLWPVHFTTACCGAEFASTSASKYDVERYGFLPFAAPRQTNLIVIEGTITIKMGEALKVIYQQMPEPKFVIAMGACALDGGIFWNSYNIVRPWQILPVEVFVPGCPPRPEALARGILMLQEKVRKGEYGKQRD